MKTIQESRNKRKEAQARARSRRIRSLIKKGMTDEQIKELFEKENNRFVLCLVYGSYTLEDGTKKVSKKKENVVPNILRGIQAAKKFAENNKLEIIGTSAAPSMWIKTDIENVDKVVEILKPVGRCSVTKPTEKVEKKKDDKKPSNNTAEAKTTAKEARKKANMKKVEMRPYYAALRKGGVSKRIKKYNKTLADKIEKWLKEHKATAAKKAEEDKNRRAKHNQLTTLEKKADKRAKKAVKHIAAKESRSTQEKRRMEHNTTMKAKRAQKAQKHVQTELKISA